MNLFPFDKKSILVDAIDQNINIFKSLQKKGKVSEESLRYYQENLDEAGQSLINIINPVAVTKNINYEVSNQDVILNQKVRINNKNLSNCLHDETAFVLYGLTLNYDTEVLLKQSNFDYALSHFQFILSKSMLLNMGKILFESCKTNYANKKLTRYAIFQQDSEKENIDSKTLWSPQQIALLIPELSCDAFQVTANEKGCLQPLFSIVGIMTAQKSLASSYK